MKKQQKLKQQKKPKKKQPVSFDERFKDKINVVGKLGVLDLLGLHQPFNIDRQPTPIFQDHVVQSSEKQKNPQNEGSPKRKFSYNENQKPKVNELNNRNRTDTLKKSQIKNEKQQKSQLPRISKSMANLIQVDLSKKEEISTKQYWRGKNNGFANKRRANSQLSCISMIKIDFQANNHFENLVKFQKINKGRNNKKALKIEKI